MKNLLRTFTTLTFLGCLNLAQAATVELDIKTEFAQSHKVKSANVIFMARNPLCQSSKGSYFGFPIITPDLKSYPAKVERVSSKLVRLSFDTKFAGTKDLCDFRFDAASLTFSGRVPGNDVLVNVQSENSRNYPRANMAMNLAAFSKVEAVCDTSTRRCDSYVSGGTVESSYGEVNLTLDSKTSRTNRKVKSSLSLEIR
jgi:hypothetical protein